MKKLILENETSQVEEQDNVISIVDWEFPRFEEAFNKLVKSAQKLGVPVPTWRKLREFDEEFDLTLKSGKIVKIKEHRIEIEVNGLAPKLEGWEFLARIEPTESGSMNMVYAVPGKTVPKEWRNVEAGRCDHCEIKRRRTNTYLVQNTQTGEIKCVGSSCLKDFLGHKSPQQIATYFSYVDYLFGGGFDADKDEDGYDGMAGFIRERYDVSLLDFLAHAAWMVNDVGWKPASYDYESTKNTALAAMFESESEKDYLARRGEKVNPSSSDRKLAEDALEWGRDNLDDWAKGDNDYLYNLAASIESDNISHRMTGIAASLIPAYNKAMEREVKEKVQRDTHGESAWVGEIKKRQTFKNLTHLATFTSETAYGTSYGHKFMDPTGNILMWWSSTRKPVILATFGKDDQAYRDAQDMAMAADDPEDTGDYPYATQNRKGNWVVMGPFEQGQKYNMKATVKDHTEYRGTKQTMISRAADVVPV